MRLEDIKAYCLNKWKAYENYPFGDIPICYKLNGKVFAQIYSKQEDFLYDAIFLPDGVAEPPREIVNQPELAVYITDFGQPDDLCLVELEKLPHARY